MVTLLMRALPLLNQPSRLADSPLCDLACVRQMAASLRGYRSPRAHVVIGVVREAYGAAWAELGEAADAATRCALADALHGISRSASARAAGVSPREISRRRRAAVEMIADDCLGRLNAP